MSHQEMRPYNRPHRILNGHNIEADDEEYSDSWLWGSRSIYPMENSAYTIRMLETNTMLPSTGNLLEAPDNLNAANNIVDNDHANPIMGCNRYLEHFGSSESMLPSAEPLFLPYNQLDDLNDLPSSTAFQSSSQVLSSTPNRASFSAPDNFSYSEYPYVGSNHSYSGYNPGSSNSVNDSLQLFGTDACTVSYSDEYDHAINQEYFENCRADLQYGYQNDISNNGMTTQHLLSSIPGTETNLSLHEAGSVLSDQVQQNTSPPLFRKEESLLSAPSHQSLNNSSYVLDASHTSKSTPPSVSQVSNHMERGGDVHKPSKVKLIIPKPSRNTSDVMTSERDTHASPRVLKRGGRKHKLSKEKRAKVSEVRRKKACANCYARHVECSKEDPCQRCADKRHLEMPCSRDDLIIYLESLSPKFLSEHLSCQAIEVFTNPLQFTNNEIYTELSTGSSHPTILLLVCEFIPTDKKILEVPDPNPKSHINAHSFSTVRSLQWGVLKHNADQLKLRCLEHIQAISNRETVNGDSKTMSWKIMQAICRFQQVDPIARTNDLLARAIKVNRLHYVLGINIFFSSAAIDKAIDSLQTKATGLPCRSRISSRVLTKQIKGVMNDLLDESTKQLLVDYNDELRDRRLETWLLCLMTHFILCMCGEEIQSATDAFIVFQITNGASDPITIRKCGTEVCRRVEVVLKHSWTLLGGKLKSLLKKRNPFRDGYQARGDRVPTETELNLINEIREVMKAHEKEVFEKAANEYYGGSSRTPDDTETFRQNNSGRLLSKYLQNLL